MKFKIIIIFLLIFNLIFSKEKESIKDFKNIKIFKENKNIKTIKDDKVIETYFLKNIDAEKAFSALNGILGVEIKFLNKEIILIGEKEKVISVLKILKKVDIPERMIMIKANIIDTSLNLFDRLGFNWKLGNAKEKMAVDFLNNKISLGSILSFGGNFLGVDIDALKENGELNIKSTPSINVIEGSNGELKIADELILMQGKKEKSISLEAGLIFKVKPKIIYKGDKEYIKLSVYSEISNFKSKNSKQKNTIETEILIKNNGSTFLGGFLETSKKNSISKTPILGDLPLFGIFFQSKNKIIQKREMYIEVEAIIYE